MRSEMKTETRTDRHERTVRKTMSCGVTRMDEEMIKNCLGKMVVSAEGKRLNMLLDAEAAPIWVRHSGEL